MILGSWRVRCFTGLKRVDDARRGCIKIDNIEQETRNYKACSCETCICQSVCEVHISRTASTSRCNLYPTATCIWTDNRYKALSRHRTSLFGGLPTVNGFKSPLASSHVDTMPLHLAISKSKLNPLNKAQPRHHQYRSTYLPCTCVSDYYHGFQTAPSPS